MKRTKIIALLLALALFAGFLSACDPKEEGGETQQSASLPILTAPSNETDGKEASVPATKEESASTESASTESKPEPADSREKETLPTSESGSPRPVPSGTEPGPSPATTEARPTEPTPTQAPRSASNEDLVDDELAESEEDLH